jgi:hypothetical protein
LKFLEGAQQYKQTAVESFPLPRYINPTVEVEFTVAFTQSHPLEVLVTSSDQRQFPVGLLSTVKLVLESQNAKWARDLNTTTNATVWRLDTN